MRRRSCLAVLAMTLTLLALQYGTLGLWVSSFAQRADSALRMAYGGVLLLGVASIGPFQFLHGATWMPPAGSVAVDWMRCLSPIPAVMELLGRRAWWFPRWLGWLPRLDVEGTVTPAAASEGPAPAADDRVPDPVG